MTNIGDLKSSTFIFNELLSLTPSDNDSDTKIECNLLPSGVNKSLLIWSTYLDVIISISLFLSKFNEWIFLKILCENFCLFIWAKYGHDNIKLKSRRSNLVYFKTYFVLTDNVNVNFATTSSEIDGTVAVTVTGRFSLLSVTNDLSIKSFISIPISHVKRTSPIDRL